jgi:hypothetical protein
MLTIQIRWRRVPAKLFTVGGGQGDAALALPTVNNFG